MIFFICRSFRLIRHHRTQIAWSAMRLQWAVAAVQYIIYLYGLGSFYERLSVQYENVTKIKLCVAHNIIAPEV